MIHITTKLFLKALYHFCDLKLLSFDRHKDVYIRFSIYPYGADFCLYHRFEDGILPPELFSNLTKITTNSGLLKVIKKIRKQ